MDEDITTPMGLGDLRPLPRTRLPSWVATVRAVLDDQTCSTCRAANGSHTIPECEYVKNGTGICRCVSGSSREREACEVCKDMDAFPMCSYSMGDVILQVCKQCVKDLKKAEV